MQADGPQNPLVNWFREPLNISDARKGSSKSLNTVRPPDLLNRLCKIKFPGVILARKAALALREAQQVKQMVHYTGMVASGWQRWLDPSVGLRRHTHKPQLQRGLSLLVGAENQPGRTPRAPPDTISAQQTQTAALVVVSVPHSQSRAHLMRLV